MVENKESHTAKTNSGSVFNGNIFIFHAFDIGDDISLEKLRKSRAIGTVPLQLPKYFKNYHIPLAVELPHPHESTKLMSCKIHSFGAVSLTYKIPFSESLESLRKQFNDIHNQYLEQSITDARSVFNKIQNNVAKAHFFQTQSHYVVIQVDTLPGGINVQQLKEKFGGIIASTLRFETQTLSEFQKNEILEGATGYFRGDLHIIDTDASFIYDAEYMEILDLFEFANIQQLELQYFDRVLDQQLNKIYEGEGKKVSLLASIPFLGAPYSDPVGALGKLKADISVITERLEGSIKLAGEPYIAELYDLLSEKLDRKNWQLAIERKLNIIHDIQRTHQHRIEVFREDTLSALIVLLIFIELVVGILHYFK